MPEPLCSGMQRKNAGFTTGTPWLMTNPCYTEINVAAQEEDPDSILNFYRKVIRLRKDYPIVVYGSYELLYPEHDKIYAYERILGQEKLLIVCNFAGEAMDLEIPAEFVEKSAKLLISNYPETKITDTLHLQPYEARVYHIEG